MNRSPGFARKIIKPEFILRVSLALNAILLVGGGVVLRERAVRPPATPVDAVTKVAPQPAEPPRKAEALAETAPESFRWSRLASSDDAEYIKNLRGVGCPERTIRDILGAEIGRRYDEKRDALNAQHGKGEIGAADLQVAVAKMWDEQNDLIGRLFSTRSSFGADGLVTHLPGSASPQDVARERHERAIQGISGETAPIAFLEPDPSLGLNEAQMEAWNQVYERFAAAVGGPGQNPNDPAYRERWQEAQVKADDQLKALFGAANVIQWEMRLRSQMPARPGE